MGKVIAGMTISLDGFVDDRHGGVGSLYPDLAALREMQPLQEAIRTTSGVVMGRRAYAMGDPNSYADNYEFQVPIFVLTHDAPQTRPRETPTLTFTFVTGGIESAITQAKAVAGDQNVMVIGGASTLQQCMRAGLVDKLHIDIRHVLLGAGLRLFEHLGTAPIELERAMVSKARGSPSCVSVSSDKPAAGQRSKIAQSHTGGAIYYPQLCGATVRG